jgi:hypothetical protein
MQNAPADVISDDGSYVQLQLRLELASISIRLIRAGNLFS